MAAGDDSGHMIFAQEFLAGDPAEIEGDLRAGPRGHAGLSGDQPIDEGGEIMRGEPLDLPAVGEERFGESTRSPRVPLRIPTGPPGNLNNAFVRDGPVLMWVT